MESLNLVWAFEIIYFLLNPSGLTQSQAKSIQFQTSLHTFAFHWLGYRATTIVAEFYKKNARKMLYYSVVMALLILQAL